MIKLVVFDLDNVIIDGEAIDEIGKLGSVETQIAEITEQAMQGDLDFETSIKERVKLLKGISLEEVKKLAVELPLISGAEETIKTLKDKNLEVAIISGSFDLVAEPLKEKLGVDYVFANSLSEEDGVLTGEVTGPLVSKSKLDVFSEFIEDKDVSIEECAAIGDGANDVSIIEAAGLGIAFNAKPVVKEIADVIIEEKDLTEIITVLDDVNNDSEEAVPEETTEEVVEEAATEEAVEDKAEVTEEATEEVVEEAATEEAEKVTEEKEAEDKKQDAPSKKSRKDKLPEPDFELADTMEGVRKQKDEKEILIASIADEREEFNRVAKEQRKIRDELNASLKENLNLAIEFRDKRNEINKQVEEAKKERNKVNSELKNLEWSSGKRDKVKLEAEIKKMDKIIETRVLDIKKENQLVKNANDLRKQLMDIHEDDKAQDKAQDLKKLSEERHAVVVELSEKAQEAHENMLVYFRKTDEIRTAADAAHKAFIDARKSASAKHEDFKMVLSEIHVVNKKLGTNKPRRRKSDSKKSSGKKNREEKEKAENIFDKFKHGKKLSTDELLLLQKYDIG